MGTGDDPAGWMIFYSAQAISSMVSALLDARVLMIEI
jgi:hypothetical protein